MKKTVTVAVRMDNEFLSLLKTAVELGQLKDLDQLTPIQQLALTIYKEARGATEAVVHGSILHCWRPHFEVVSELRKVAP